MALDRPRRGWVRTAGPGHREGSLARYFKSHHVNTPVVYVEDEGRWLGYAPNGMLQRAAGGLPEVIRSRTIQITQDEAERLIALWRAQASGPEPPVAAPAPEGLTIYGPAGRRRTGRPGRLIVISTLSAVVVVILVLAALAVGGRLGSGANPSPPGGSVATETTEIAPEDVVATVGLHRISRQQLQQKTADFVAQYGEQIPDRKTDPDRYRLFQEDVLDYLVTHELASQGAAPLGIAVTDADVQAAMALILRVSFSGDQERFAAAVAEHGLTMEQFQRIYKESMLLNKVYAEVGKAASVTDADIQAHYDRNRAQTYKDTPLAEVRSDIESTLLDGRQQRLWQDWLAQERQTIGVGYTNGWGAPSNALAGAGLRPPE